MYISIFVQDMLPVQNNPSEIEPGPPRLSLNHARRTLQVEDRDVPLSRLEYGLLRILFQNAGSVVETRMITEELWGDQLEKKTLAVRLKSVVKRLRTKIGDELRSPRIVIAARGHGYFIEGSSAPPSTAEDESAEIDPKTEESSPP